MEWHFSKACGFRFGVSLDNLEGGDDAVGDPRAFRARVWQQAGRWQAAGLPPRAARFATALRREFGQSGAECRFTLAELD